MTNLVRRPGHPWSLIEKTFDPFHKFGVGFEDLFGDLFSLKELGMNTFPPHNIRKKGNTYFIDLAVAGLNKEDLEVTLENGMLTVSGKTSTVPSDEGDDTEYLYKGIAERSFTRTWRLGEHVEVLNAKMENGTLTIELQKEVPEEEESLRRIEIE